jgi:hypothetical protein
MDRSKLEKIIEDRTPEDRAGVAGAGECHMSQGGEVLFVRRVPTTLSPHSTPLHNAQTKSPL